MDETKKLRYPIGPFVFPEQVNSEHRKQWIQTIADFPADLKAICQGLNPEQLNARYRPGGWTLKQVVHHCADSHLNSYLRFKLAMTEDSPTICAYDEVAWAELPDSLENDLESSLGILTGLHARWTMFLNNLADEDWERTFFHPVSKERTSLIKNLAAYDWHCRHHLGHVKLALASVEVS